MDDGMPYTGIFFAFKSGFGQNQKINTENYCTNLAIDNSNIDSSSIDKAKYSIYNSNSKK